MGFRSLPDNPWLFNDSGLGGGMTNDKQKHSCVSCAFFERKELECRRESPKPLYVPGYNKEVRGWWPTVILEDWCGNYKGKNTHGLGACTDCGIELMAIRDFKGKLYCCECFELLTIGRRMEGG